MVHYVRFLKAPKLCSERAKLSVTALVAVTTDLGDDFFHADLPLHATLVQQDRQNSSWKTLLWKSGMRTLVINFQDLSPSIKLNDLTLVVSSRRSMEADKLALECMPEVLGARSRVVMPNLQHTDGKIERRLQTGTECVYIFEDAGESIARHIWDAGVALIAYLNGQRNQPMETCSSSVSLASRLRKAHGCGLRVLELGSGCGLVGLWISTALPHSRVTLTDLPEAMDTLAFNIDRAIPATGSGLRRIILDWNCEIPKVIQKSDFDMFIVSDCTYNCDSIPSLVKMIAALIAQSPDALVVVSMKFRHDSESIFFELMSNAGLSKQEHESVKLGSRQRAQLDLPPESVDVYLYQSSDAAYKTKSITTV